MYLVCTHWKLLGRSRSQTDIKCDRRPAGCGVDERCVQQDFRLLRFDNKPAGKLQARLFGVVYLQHCAECQHLDTVASWSHWICALLRPF